MGMVKLITTQKNFIFETLEDETLLQAFRRLNIPAQATLMVNQNEEFVSLTKILKKDEFIEAYCVNNPNYDILIPNYAFKECIQPVTELIRPLHNPISLGIIQYTRQEAYDKIYANIEHVMNQYVQNFATPNEHIQVALSAGGDSRALAEMLAKYKKENQNIHFDCVIMSLGFEEEKQHIESASKIAEQFELPYVTYNSEQVAKEFGYKSNINEICDEYKKSFSNDETEVLGTYWVQELNIKIAKANNRKAIIFGYNQEDIVAEKFYQLILGKFLPSYPIRTINEMHFIAPLCLCPKKLLDAMDYKNSIRNYHQRIPSVSYLRSALYLLAYTVGERFPALADMLSGPGLAQNDPDKILHWLKEYQAAS